LVRIRKEKGLAITSTKRVRREGKYWIVPSQSNPEQVYKVVLRIDGSECTCKDYVSRGLKCKHIWAVELTVEKQVNEDGTTTITQMKRITYPQDWSNYTKAQTEEGGLFKVLLKDLVKNIPEEPYVFGKTRYPLKEALFCAIDKVYSMQSSRRAESRYKDAEEKAQITKALTTIW